MAGFTNKGKSYKKPKRDIAKREIRHLIVDKGLTNRQISERLNVPQRTVERYIAEVYEHDNQLLTSLNSDSTVLIAWSIVRERLDAHRQEILQNIARNSNASFTDQIKAWNLICELEAADLRILHEAAPMLSRRSALPVKRAMMMSKEEEEYDFEEEQEQQEPQEQQQQRHP